MDPGRLSLHQYFITGITVTAVYFLNFDVVFKVLPAGPGLTVTYVIVTLLDLKENRR
jgi:hypothetical protein